MSSRKGAGKSSFGKGRRSEHSAPDKGGAHFYQLDHEMAAMSIGSIQESEWEFVGKKSKNQGGAASANPSLTTVPKPWGYVEGVQMQGWGNHDRVGRNSNQVIDSWRSGVRGNHARKPPDSGWESEYITPHPTIPLPLQHGWQWAGRSGSSGSESWSEGKSISISNQEGSDGAYNSESGKKPSQLGVVSDEDDDFELVDDSDGDISDDYDSDVSQKSHETRKKNKWFRAFFEKLDRLTIEKINEQTRQWHCPACQDGPGAIDWYKGLQPLVTHAKTKGKKRVKLHREFAELLEEELQRRGTSAIPSGEVFGKWRGLHETTTEHEIVWPPMVVIMNTLLEQDENDKWIGMGNQELVEYFSTYAAVKARHSYGPKGHQGMSVLIFEASPMGYMNAERLHKQFVQEGRDRYAWERKPYLFYPAGKRQLYGYLAQKKDMDDFNRHSHGKMQLMFVMKLYHEMVVIPLKQMSENNQKLHWFKNKASKEEKRSKTLEQSVGVMSQKLRETVEENMIVRLRTKTQLEENKEEMDYQERFFKEQMDNVHKAMEEKERQFELLLQEERAKARLTELYPGTCEDQRMRKEKIFKFIEGQVKGVEEFEAEREKLSHSHEEKKLELRRKQLQEEVQLEQEFDDKLTQLMEKYAPTTFLASESS